MKILFVCDIHGSNIIFNKLLSTVSENNIDVLIISGDLSGKDIRPIIENDNEFTVEFNGELHIYSNEEICEFEKMNSGLGHYFFYTTKEILEKFKKTPTEILEILDRKILERIETWIQQIIKQIDLKTTSIVISPGNDDIFEINTLIENYRDKGIYSGLINPIEIGEFRIITLDYSNPTPWQTERELNEKQLEILINSKVREIKSFKKTIFNFHCPPYKTKLDIAPEIDKNLRFVVNPGGINKTHIGSKAVLNSILKYQPVLSLHGHVHESPGFDYIGNTLALNPGSEYEKGILNAYIIELENDGNINNYYLIEK